jgi:glucan 1,3-beta-glucosidase
MRSALGLAAAVLVAIVAFWWRLGTPVPMPPSPFAQGEKLHCVSYTPFRGSQTPLDLTTHIDAAQIEDDLARLARLTDCVRTYSTNLGLDQVAGIAARHGLKVMQGIWLGRTAERNRQETETAVALAKQYPDVIRAIIVGNEVLLRGELGQAAVAKAIREVKAQVSVPVTYADVWEFWLRNREVYDAVDFVTIHILPYWEDFPIPAAEAAAHVESIRRQVVTSFPDKEVLIGEVGWPSQGRMREGALPSPATQARVLHDVLTMAKRENVHVNVIEAFDQPWKRALEGTVGGRWGLLDADSRAFKFAWGEAVSNHPHWPLQAAAGAMLAGLVFLGAALARRGGGAAPGPETGRWLTVALIALVSGSLIGWTLENVPVESLGIGGWARSLAMVALALASPVAAAAGVMRRLPAPAFSAILGGRQRLVRDPLAVALGTLLIGLVVVALEVALGLGFDPRYRDFPFAPLTGAAVPFLLLMLAVAPRKGARGVAETMSAAVLVAATVYIAFNESYANWEAMWLCADLAAVAVTLMRSRDVQS